MDREITLRDYGRVLWSGRWLIVAAAVAAAFVGLVLSFVSSTTYTATAEVFLGQPTTVSGTPVQTPLTSAATAADVLRRDDLVKRVAEQAGVSAARVKRNSAIEVPRGQGAQSQPSLATITVKDSSRIHAKDIARAYAEVALAEAETGFRDVTGAYRSRLASSRAEVTRLENEIDLFQRQVQASQGSPAFLSWQILLSNAQDQLSIAQTAASEQQILLAKANQSEAPRINEIPEGVRSSSSARNRLRTVLIAGIIGLLVGVMVTFVWRGSPAGRARPTA
ncbi:MAG: Chain length determinant protein [Miltoncostaeaceae bacterium]|nr:Chain length determinant protein [Miltoncostaeaceae bacterium]